MKHKDSGICNDDSPLTPKGKILSPSLCDSIYLERPKTTPPNKLFRQRPGQSLASPLTSNSEQVFSRRSFGLSPLSEKTGKTTSFVCDCKSHTKGSVIQTPLDIERSVRLIHDLPHDM